MSRRSSSLSCLALTAALAPAAGAVAAQEGPTLLDFISPDRIAARVLQMGILAARTQADITYGGISVQALSGSATLTDVKVWPILDWEMEGACEITLDRVRLNGTPIEDLDHLTMAVSVTGASANTDCIPPDLRGTVTALGMDSVTIPRATFRIDYTLSTAAALVRAHAVAEGLASVSADIDLDYLWMDGRHDMEEPDPVVFLNSASLVFENLGLWEAVQPMLPPMATDPEQSALMIDGAMGGILGDAQTDQARAMAESVKSAWAAFLADPQRLVLETGFTDGPRYLDMLAWDDGPAVILDDLEPRAALTSAPARAMLPSALLTKAYDAPDTLTGDERLQVGSALASGTGAPRDAGQAEALLRVAADEGSATAARVLAEMLETRDPAGAYGMALLAAQGGAEGAAGLLDRLERELPLADVLSAQHALVEGVDQPVEALESLASIRNEAAMRLSGKGRSRSYEIAALWATIGAAAGDAESQSILDEIDGVVAGADDAAMAVWTAQEATSAELARSAWIGFDLPAKLGGVN